MCKTMDIVNHSAIMGLQTPQPAERSAGVSSLAMEITLFIDGRNFLGKLEDVFRSERRTMPEWATYDFRELLDQVLKGLETDKRVFYFAKIKEHQDTREKSLKLILERRLLKTHLEKQGFEVVLSGAVRGNYIKNDRGKEILVFKEKGVDISIAVDMIVAACGGKLKTAILGSSDFDLQPAIRELNKRNVESIYLGFEIMPNKGLTATTKRTILIRNSEVLQFSRSLPL